MLLRIFIYLSFITVTYLTHTHTHTLAHGYRDKIEAFIDDNKALMKRMYGDFEMNEDYGSVLSQSKKRKRNARSGDAFEPDWAAEMSGPPGSGPDPIREANASGDSYFAKIKQQRKKRQSRQRGGSRGGGITGGTGR